MSEERLHFRLERDETHLGSRHWNVSVEYIFKNTSEKVVKLTMGFPYQLVYTGGVLKDGTGAVAPYIEAFQVSINQNSLPNDQITTVRFKELFGQRGINTSWKKGQWKTTDEDFARYEAYTWKASFLPLETVRIAHTYKTRASTGIGRPFMVDYILRTGGLWKGGRIGRAMIEVETGSAFRPCDKTEHFLTAMRDFKPSFFGATELITQAQDAKSALPLQFGQLAELRNTAYAAHGKIFSLPNLDSFFRRQWWYRPNAKYTDALLTKEGRQLLNMIAVEERRLATKPTE
ncbi:MAG: YARHG domain-containing protein [Proteobacteria bacterium]|nr:YARHG domain-containing protein [Pseudomonadota bacterium]